MISLAVNDAILSNLFSILLKSPSVTMPASELSSFNTAVAPNRKDVISNITSLSFVSFFTTGILFFTQTSSTNKYNCFPRLPPG